MDEDSDGDRLTDGQEIAGQDGNGTSHGHGATDPLDMDSDNGGIRDGTEVDTDAGKILRLKQQFFFVSASLHDMVRNLEKCNVPLEEFPNRYQVQLNDTHPAVAVAEMMRILVDLKHFEWEPAWEIVSKRDRKSVV